MGMALYNTGNRNVKKLTQCIRKAKRRNALPCWKRGAPHSLPHTVAPHYPFPWVIMQSFPYTFRDMSPPITKVTLKKVRLRVCVFTLSSGWPTFCPVSPALCLQPADTRSIRQPQLAPPISSEFGCTSHFSLYCKAI